MAEPVEKPISEFVRIPESLFQDAAKSGPGGDKFHDEYIVSVINSENQSVDVLVTSTGSDSYDIKRTENLERYKKNPDAKNSAIERLFKQAADGNPVKVQVSDWRGKATAFVRRVNMNG